MANRTVIGTFRDPITDELLSDAPVSFRLVRSFVTNSEIHIKKHTEIKTDLDGQISIQLAVPEDENLAAQYQCVLPDATTFAFALSVGTDPVDLSSLYLQGGATTPSSQLQQLLEQYLTEEEAAQLYAALTELNNEIAARQAADTTLTNNLVAHTSNTNNPHSTTAVQVGADPVGTAAAAIATHLAVSDPHSQYYNQSRADARYVLLTALANHLADVANPHAVTAAQVGALTQAVADSLYASISALTTESTNRANADTALTASVATKEASLGNPAANGYVLQSTSVGIRSWLNLVVYALIAADNQFSAAQGIRAAASGVAAGMYVPWLSGDTLPAIVGGTSSGNQPGIHGRSSTNAGVYGSAGANGQGVFGSCPGGQGVRGDGSTGVGILGNATTGYAGSFASTSGVGILGSTTTGLPLWIVKTPSGTNDTSEIVRWSRRSNETPPNEFGIKQVTQLNSSTTPDQIAAEDATVWTDATHATRTARRSTWLTRNAVLTETMICGGATAGLHIPWLSGDTKPSILGGASTAGNNQDGVQGISATGIGVRGISTSGNGVEGTSSSGVSVRGQATSNVALQGQCTSGIGVRGYATTGTPLDLQRSDVGAGTAATLMQMQRIASSTPSNGFGSKIAWLQATSTLATRTAAEDVVTWTDVTDATRTAKRSLWLTRNGVLTEVNIVDNADSATQTNMTVYFNGAQRRIEVGAADSGGTGYRMLRIAN